MEGRKAALKAENEALRKELALRSTAQNSSETGRLAAIERKMEELGPSLIWLVEERLQNSERKGEKEVVPDETTRKVEPGVPNTPATKGGQADAMEWQTVERRNKRKKEPAKNQPVKLIPGTEVKSPRKVPEGGSENAWRGGDKLLLPTASAVTIILQDRSGQSYTKVLAAAKDSVFLVEVGINAVKMRKTMTRGVLEVSEDQKREKAAVLVARLIRALDPIKVRMAIPFQAMESRVTRIDISAIKEEITNTLAKESGCKAEDVRLGEIRLARNGLRSAWIRGSAGAVGKLAQTGKVAIGWSIAKVEGIECYRCLEIGHISKTCTS